MYGTSVSAPTFDASQPLVGASPPVSALFQDQPICPDPGYALFLYYKTNSFVNYANYSNPEVDSLITQGLATLAPDQEKPIWNSSSCRDRLLEMEPLCLVLNTVRH